MKYRIERYVGTGFVDAEIAPVEAQSEAAGVLHALIAWRKAHPVREEVQLRVVPM